MQSDFTGFTFDGVHSSELNILRVSNGDRYEEQILPDLEDKTIEQTGRDGVYYYGSFYGSRAINIDIAFDSVTEEQYRNIRRLFGQKKICKLIFDERPYKVYYVKIAEPITLETVCFDEPYKQPFSEVYPDEELPDGVRWETITGTNTERTREKVDPWIVDYNRIRRIYKGEGSISFIAYDPFARQLYKTLDQYLIKGYDNVPEWAASSGILTAQEYEDEAIDKYRSIDTESVENSNLYNGQINLYNPGDIDTPYFLFIPYVENRIDPGENSDYIIIGIDGAKDLIIEPFEKDLTMLLENGILINSRAELIEGVIFDYSTKSWKTTGNIYNRYIKEGHFGRIFKGNSFNFRNQRLNLNCKVDSESEIRKPYVFYNYLYY